ncbi:MAG: 2-succinyl-5-enolpyruvyl-6-hydroxy-3-cyclohexene-1-carboxylic-acid synthase [Verrucomicrobiales bacterium]
MSIALATDVLEVLARIGAREFCVCGGARNAALLAVLSQSRGFRLWNFPEERCAGFFAVGRAMKIGQPVTIVTTSGTAAAELLPAAIEARYQNLPLILLTADRPARFRGTGAPQAIEQVGLFGGYASPCADIHDGTLTASVRHVIQSWDQFGPLHVNLCLEEPADLDGAQDIVCGYSPSRKPSISDGSESLVEFIGDRGGLVVMLGALNHSERAHLVPFLQRLGCPIYAEATSGLRENASLEPLHVRGEFQFAELNARKILRIGGVPVSRFWRDLEGEPEIQVLSVTHSTLSALARPSTVCGFPQWDSIGIPHDPVAAAAFFEAGPASKRPAALCGGSEVPEESSLHPAPEAALISRLSECIPSRSLVFLGNSLPIRQWNEFASRQDRGLRCFASRGANGIDGALSTFFGLSADEAESWCLVGDLTALYDLASPWILRQLPRARRRIVILNNRGGHIFRHVSGLRGLPASAWPLIENPHDLDFRGWAALWRMGFRIVKTAEEFMQSIDEDSFVIEVNSSE